jgi:hypothetical protein
MGSNGVLFLAVIAVTAAEFPKAAWVRLRCRLYAKGRLPERALPPAVVGKAERLGSAWAVSGKKECRCGQR